MPVNKYAAFYGHLLFPGTHMVTGYVMVVGTVDRVVNALEAIPATCSAAASCLLKHHRIPLIRRVAQDGSKSYVATESCGLTGLTDDATFGFKVELFSAVEASIFLRKWIFEKLNLSDDGASDLPKILCAEEGVIPDELVLVAEIVIEESDTETKSSLLAAWAAHAVGLEVPIEGLAEALAASATTAMPALPAPRTCTDFPPGSRVRVLSKKHKTVPIGVTIAEGASGKMLFGSSLTAPRSKSINSCLTTKTACYF